MEYRHGERFASSQGADLASEVPAVLAIAVAFASPTSAQQGPSPAAADPGRKVDSPRAATSGTPDLSASRHPLDPLEPAEIVAAVAAIRKERKLPDSVRFVTVTLKEPSKEVVAAGRGPAANSRARRS